MSNDPTFAERFDAAETGKEFGIVLNDLFAYLEKARKQEEER